MAGILNTLSGLASALKNRAESLLDSLFPPEKRAELLTRLQAFAINNPKLSAFLLSNIAFTGLPLLMFAVFTLTVFVFSFLVALLIGLLAALLFTAFMVGLALIVILPIVFMTTMGASFLFLWGLGGYYILKWFSEGESPAPEGTAIGDKLNKLTGGRLGFLMEGARAQEAKGEGTGEDKEERREPPSNGSAKSTNPELPDVAKSIDAGNTTGRAAGQIDGVTRRVAGAAGTVKGAVGGVTGL